jgi:hypothetical protein
MARPSRAEIFDPNEVAIAHVYNRTVRRCFLMGDDALSGKNFDHRKTWIEEWLRQFAALFGIDLICYAIMSNHFHLILRSRPDVVATWDNREVARRWLMLCPIRRCADSKPLPPTEAEINLIANCPVKCQEMRKRLSSISWWMRLLCQRVAQRANHEEKERGRFFQDRFGATLLTDEASLLACAAYVDLNPIRAAMAMTLESSAHTSVQTRIKALKTQGVDAGNNDQQSPEDAFLSPLTINEQTDPIGPSPSRNGKRCSDKGVLAMPIEEYLALLDWTARESVLGKRGSTPSNVPPVLSRLGLDSGTWRELVSDFGKLFCHVAGRPEHVDTMRTHRTHRRFYLRRRARELFAAT